MVKNNIKRLYFFTGLILAFSAVNLNAMDGEEKDFLYPLIDNDQPRNIISHGIFPFVAPEGAIRIGASSSVLLLDLKRDLFRNKKDVAWIDFLEMACNKGFEKDEPIINRLFKKIEYNKTFNKENEY